MQALKNIIREYPVIYDKMFRIKRIIGFRDHVYTILNNYSLKKNKIVKFIQIGANDGLRNDPIREFIVRDNWEGILIEPVPYAFMELKKNYSRYSNKNLVFLNAAVTPSQSLSFWTFKDDYLNGLPKEARMDHLRKSSFSYEHVSRYIGNKDKFDNVANCIPVDGINYESLLATYCDNIIDLLVIDAEGHEDVILKDVLDNDNKPSAIFYEHHNIFNLADVESRLLSNGYKITKVGGDSFAEVGGVAE